MARIPDDLERFFLAWRELGMISSDFLTRGANSGWFGATLPRVARIRDDFERFSHVWRELGMISGGFFTRMARTRVDLGRISNISHEQENRAVNYIIFARVFNYQYYFSISKFSILDNKSYLTFLIIDTFYVYRLILKIPSLHSP